MMKRVVGVLRTERRRSQRHAVRLHVYYVWTGLIFEARTIDVSMTGMCLQTQVDLGVGSILEARFALSDDDAMQSIDAEVVWSRPVRTPQDDESFQCGLRFVAVTEPFSSYLKTALPKGSGDELPLADEDDVIELSQPNVVAFDDAIQVREAFRFDVERHGRLQAEAAQLIDRAKAATDAGDLDSAIEILEGAVTHLPTSADALEALGEALYKQGNVVRAASCFDRALRLRQESDD